MSILHLICSDHFLPPNIAIELLKSIQEFLTLQNDENIL